MDVEVEEPPIDTEAVVLLSVEDGGELFAFFRTPSCTSSIDFVVAASLPSRDIDVSGGEAVATPSRWSSIAPSTTSPKLSCWVVKSN